MQQPITLKHQGYRNRFLTIVEIITHAGLVVSVEMYPLQLSPNNNTIEIHL